MLAYWWPWSRSVRPLLPPISHMIMLLSDAPEKSSRWIGSHHREAMLPRLGRRRNKCISLQILQTSGKWEWQAWNIILHFQRVGINLPFYKGIHLPSSDNHSWLHKPCNKSQSSRLEQHSRQAHLNSGLKVQHKPATWESLHDKQWRRWETIEIFHGTPKCFPEITSSASPRLGYQIMPSNKVEFFKLDSYK